MTGAYVDEQDAIGRGHGGNAGRELQPIPAHVAAAWAEELPPVDDLTGAWWQPLAPVIPLPRRRPAGPEVLALVG